ncbi:MAG: hypothetical protein ACOH2F_04485 [Cellulomonas sp.]
MNPDDVDDWSLERDGSSLHPHAMSPAQRLILPSHLATALLAAAVILTSAIGLRLFG